MKKLFISLSNKGGVGKSMLSKVMVELYREKYPTKIEAYDCDYENHGLANIYSQKDEKGYVIEKQDPNKGVVVLDIKDGRGRDEMLNVLSRNDNTEVVLFDMPANNVSTFSNIIENAETYVMACKELGYEVYILNLVSNDFESLMSLQECYEMFGNEVNYVIVFNNAFLKQEGNHIRQIYSGEKSRDGFTFNKKQVEKSVNSFNEIELFELHTELNNYLKENRIKFGDFIDKFSDLEAQEKSLGIPNDKRIVTVANKVRLKGFLDKMRKEFAPLL